MKRYSKFDQKNPNGPVPEENFWRRKYNFELYNISGQKTDT